MTSVGRVDDAESQEGTTASKNAILDPMERIPFEISSDIFLQAVPARLNTRAILNLHSVCRRWRDIAHATPSLWAEISNNGIRSTNFSALLETWVPRSQPRLLLLSLHYMLPRTLAGIVDQLGDHASRVENLQLVRPGATLLEGDPDVDVVIRLASLKFLSIEGASPRHVLQGMVDRVAQILRDLPNLVSYTIKYLRLYNDLPPTDRHRVIHSSLQHLYLGDFSENVDHSAYLLKRLILPSLRTLQISSTQQISLSDLHQFLTRSKAPLHTLRISIPHTHNETALLECLRLTPRLVNLEIMYLGTDVGSLFDLLAAAPDVLPILCDFTICGYVLDPSGFQSILNGIMRRRQVLGSFKFLVQSVDRESDEIQRGMFQYFAAEFRELRRHGMRIHVGPRGGNFL